MVTKSRASKPKPKKHSSRLWLDRQQRDPYIAQAKSQGYRSRAAFKLLEIQARDQIFKKGMTVVDLGAAPGGFSQVAAKIVGQKGLVLALDKLPMDSLSGVDIILGDFQEDEVFEALKTHLSQHAIHHANNGNGTVSGNDTVDGMMSKVDLVMSDMSPNLSGMKAIDQPRSIYLAELALDFAEQVLCEGGTLLVKVFQGEGFPSYWAMLKERFAFVAVRKPKASRPESNEVYLLAKGFISSIRGKYLERYA